MFDFINSFFKTFFNVSYNITPVGLFSLFCFISGAVHYNLNLLSFSHVDLNGYIYLYLYHISHIVTCLHHCAPVFQGYTGLDGRKGEPGGAGPKVRWQLAALWMYQKLKTVILNSSQLIISDKFENV